MKPSDVVHLESAIRLIVQLVRELPLEEYLATHTIGGGSAKTELVKQATVLRMLKPG